MRLIGLDGRALTRGKDRTHLYSGAAILLRNTALGASVAALIVRVHPDDTPTSDRDGNLARWHGSRPFVDAIAIGFAPPELAQPVLVTMLPCCSDLLAEDADTPCYDAIVRLEGTA